MFQGDGAKILFSNESGGHRWQRIPPNEKRGRVHTSTVTVAVLDSVDEQKTFNVTNDIMFQTTRGSGCGGQHKNKTDSCVIATHVPTGITVRIDGRSQYQNKQVAIKLIASRVSTMNVEKSANDRDQCRKLQVGSGMRGDKVRTYRLQDDQVTDHRSGEKSRLQDWLRGSW